MEVKVTITYSTDNPELINESVAALLENSLPFMADNVTIVFDTQED